jgi:hypothetical protein
MEIRTGIGKCSNAAPLRNIGELDFRLMIATDYYAAMILLPW